MNHTLSAAMNLMYELQRCKKKEWEINQQIASLYKSDDFPPRIAATIGKIEKYIVAMLDLYFNDVTDTRDIASHVLYETGIVHCDGDRCDLNNRRELENFVEYLKERK